MTANARGRLARLYRYPVKGMTAEPLAEIALHPGAGVPGDRVFALARPDTVFDEDRPEALGKQRFVMLQKDEALARIRAAYDPATNTVEFGRTDPTNADPTNADPTRPGSTHPDPTAARRRADISTEAGRVALEEFVAEVIGPGLGGRPRLVAGRGAHRFTDAGVGGPELMHAVSVVNLASVRDLADRIGVEVDPLRFRANIYIDDVPAWSELDWAGREIGLGPVRVRVLARTPRCAATAVNPTTARRDIRMLRELADHYRHTDCGIYVTVLTGGLLRPGDPVTSPTGREGDEPCGS